MKTTTGPLVVLMKTLTWVIFIGLLIKTGAIIVSYIVSFTNPDATKNLYMGLNLSALHKFSVKHYTLVVWLTVVLTGLKAYIAYLVIRILLKINFSRPFNAQMAQLITKISEVTLEAGLIALAAEVYSEWLISEGVNPKLDWGSAEFLFLAGVIFVIAQVFKKGVEIQSENELTI